MCMLLVLHGSIYQHRLSRFNATFLFPVQQDSELDDTGVPELDLAELLFHLVRIV